MANQSGINFTHVFPISLSIYLKNIFFAVIVRINWIGKLWVSMSDIGDVNDVSFSQAIEREKIFKLPEKLRFRIIWINCVVVARLEAHTQSPQISFSFLLPFLKTTVIWDKKIEINYTTEQTQSGNKKENKKTFS